MTESDHDYKLGMGRSITRRDFLNGVAVGIGALGLSQLANGDTAPYPPALSGMRGSQPGAFDVAHSLRDGVFWETAGTPEDTHESYDLIVVGGGISGLAAAYFYRQQAGTKSRILILENHDDFGGHARRNEFQVGKRLLLSNGGTQSIESPSEYSDVAKGLLKDLGIHTQRFYKAYDQKLYSHLGTACFFDKPTFGEDRLVAGMGSLAWPVFLAKSPLPDKVRQEIARLYTEKKDYLPGLSRKRSVRAWQRSATPISSRRYATLIPRCCRFSRATRTTYGRWESRRSLRWRASIIRTTTAPISTPASMAWIWGLTAAKLTHISSTFPMGMPRSRGCWCAL